MGNSVSTFVMEILTPEDSISGYKRLDPVTGTIKLFFWIGATMALTVLVSRLQ
ncbi:hypothetical protein [Maridesulfovibrio ferrireducens]|uniref:Uncharacterized protein n=1 Tax=Maridesulfovibrio ferrireducens TaxID=246191 RepID=A0A1G9BLG5_9BACT|nr:hypothetical protein [Maridesulfovibrio ferrireducens]MBI9112059.1 hypothetical protein [Maridesulfovibrio ferrireducens]SDK39954.1 hypothetical protein SAMN05660337_0328 [Maridesulfovibrio ferrireducens]